MAATNTLATTTLVEAVSPSATSIKVASSSGLVAGVRLWVDKELMSVSGLGVPTSTYATVNVKRGVDGTSSHRHSATAVITYGRADQFYQTDPQGAPPQEVFVSPHINVLTGTVWFAQGDSNPLNGNVRWWQQQTTTYGIGPMGVGTVTLTPTSST